jgi:hypothetical protein
VGELDAPTVDTDEIRPPFGAAVEVVERFERFGVGRVLRKDVDVPLGSLVDLAEPLVDVREPHPVVAREGGVREPLGDLVEDRVELVPRVGLAREPLELDSRFCNRRVVFERPGLRLERQVYVAERVDGDASNLAVERDAPADVLLGLGQDLEGAHELLPVASYFVDALENAGSLRAEIGVVEERFERLARAFVRRIEEEDLTVVLERGRRILEVFFERTAESELEVDELGLAEVELDAPTQDVDVGVVVG